MQLAQTSMRREGIVQNLYYRWSKEFLEAGKKRLAGDTARAATSEEVKDLRREASALKEVVAELMLENRLLKKARSGLGSTAHEIPRCRETGDHPAGRAIPRCQCAAPWPNSAFPRQPFTAGTTGTAAAGRRL